MDIKVIHPKCGKNFQIKWGKQVFVCPKCKELVSIKDVTLAKGEVVRLFD